MDNTSAPQAPAPLDPRAPEVVDDRRLRLPARDGAAVVEIGVVARGERACSSGSMPGVPTSASRRTRRLHSKTRPQPAHRRGDHAGRARARARGRLALPRRWAGAAPARGVGDRRRRRRALGIPGARGELRLRVVVCNPILAMAALCVRAGGACLVQTLHLHALAHPIKNAVFHRVFRRA